jgi:hypothetical protein
MTTVRLLVTSAVNTPRQATTLRLIPRTQPADVNTWSPHDVMCLDSRMYRLCGQKLMAVHMPAWSACNQFTTVDPKPGRIRAWLILIQCPRPSPARALDRLTRTMGRSSRAPTNVNVKTVTLNRVDRSVTQHSVTHHGPKAIRFRGSVGSASGTGRGRTTENRLR